MAFNWNFRPRTLNGFNSAPVESFIPQAPGAIPTQMKGQGFSPDYNIQGLPQDTEDYQRAAYMDAYEADEAQKAQALQMQEAGRKNRIADIQNQIVTLKKRIAENEAKLKNFASNVDQIAAIEARKINTADPTSIWRWKVDRDEARRIAQAEKDKSKQLTAANALIEATNAIENMVVDPSMDTPTANAMLSKLADIKSNLQKNGLPTKMADDKIAEIKGDNKKVIIETSETEDDVTYEGKDREQNESKASRLLNKKNVTVKELENASKSNVSNDTKNKLLSKRDEVKAKNIQEEKDQKRENGLLGKGKFLTSEEIQFMEGRKDVKKHTDNFGNIWFTKR